MNDLTDTYVQVITLTATRLVSLLGLLGSRDPFPSRDDVDGKIRRYNHACKLREVFARRRERDPSAERTEDELMVLDEDGELESDVVSDVQALESAFRRARPDYVVFSDAVLRENDILAKAFFKDHASLCGTDAKTVIKALMAYAQTVGDKCLEHFTPYGSTDSERQQHIGSVLGRLYYAFHSSRWLFVDEPQYLMDWPLFSEATFSGIVNECTMYSRGWRRVSGHCLPCCVAFVARHGTYVYASQVWRMFDPAFAYGTTSTKRTGAKRIDPAFSAIDALGLMAGVEKQRTNPNAMDSIQMRVSTLRLFDGVSYVHVVDVV